MGTSTVIVISCMSRSNCPLNLVVTVSAFMKLDRFVLSAAGAAGACKPDMVLFIMGLRAPPAPGAGDAFPGAPGVLCCIGVEATPPPA
jgi:hypothetical protein